VEDDGTEELTILGAFTIGLAHSLVPCEDKAVVSLYALWGSERWREGILLVVLYGLGMMLINTCFGFAFALVGAGLFETFMGVKETLEIVSGVITVAFGFFMLKGHSLVHLVHHHRRTTKEESEETELLSFGKSAALLFGLVRGLPPCPFELAAYLLASSMGNVLAGTAAVFMFGLGTTLGLIPIGFAMGGVARAAKRSRYSVLVPKVCGLIIMVIGVVIALSPLLNIEI